jgi:hypothetical protein
MDLKENCYKDRNFVYSLDVGFSNKVYEQWKTNSFHKAMGFLMRLDICEVLKKHHTEQLEDGCLREGQS